MTNAVTVSAPSSGTVGDVLDISGTVTPATDTVVLQLGLSASIAPTGAWVAALTVSGIFNGTLKPAAPGIWYAWAWDQATSLQAVSGPISVPNPALNTLQAVPLSTQQVADLLATPSQGESVPSLAVAAAVASSDTFPVSQGSTNLVQQSFTAVWTWITSLLPSYFRPRGYLAVSTALDSSDHNGRVLVVTAAGVTISINTNSISAGFGCTIINASGSTVALSGFTTSTGATTIAANGAAIVEAYQIGTNALVMYAKL